MFKRRKLDEHDAEPADVGSLSEAEAPARPVAGKAADTGLGVPPFRPASIPAPIPAPSAPPTPALSKDDTMARSPFSTTPPPSSPTPMSSGTAIPAAPSGSGLGAPSGLGRSMGGPAPGRPAGREQGERRTLVVGRGISVQGSVQDAERLVVEGTVEASNIHAAELAINAGGVFKGEVEVEDAEIAGTIDGTLTVRGSLIVRASGRVLGTARCRRLQVEDGGQITGRIEMLTGSEHADPARPVPFAADRIEAPRPPEPVSASAG